MSANKENNRISFSELIEGLSNDEKKIVTKYLDFNTATSEELACMIKKLQENEQIEICLILAKKIKIFKRKRYVNNIRTAILVVKYIILGVIIGLILTLLSILRY